MAARGPDEEATPRRPGHIVQIGKQTLVYGLSGVSLQLVGLITLPIFGRVFSPSDYGVLELATVGSSVAITLVDAGMTSASQRSFYDYDDTRIERRRSVITTAMLFSSALAFLCAIAVILARDPLSLWLFDGEQHDALVIAVAVSLPLINAANLARQTMRLRFRAWRFVISSSLAAFVSAGVGVIAVTVFDAGVIGVFIGIIAGNVLSMVYGLFVIRGDLSRSFSRFQLSRMLRYGVPLIPTALALWGLAFLDRIMLSRLSNLDEVGQYAIANRVASVLTLAVVAFTTAVGPQLFALYSSDRQLEKFIRARVLTYLTVVLCFGGLWLALFAQQIVRIVAPGYDQAYQAVGLLLLSIVLFGASGLTMAGISYTRRSTYFAVGAGLALIIHVGVNFALIPSIGMLGAAVSTLAAYGLLAVFYLVVSQRLYPTRYEGRKVLVTLTLAAALGVLGVVPLGPPASELTVKLLAILVFVVAIRVLRVVGPEETREVKNLLGGIFRRPAAQARA